MDSKGVKCTSGPTIKETQRRASENAGATPIECLQSMISVDSATSDITCTTCLIHPFTTVDVTKHITTNNFPTSVYPQHRNGRPRHGPSSLSLKSLTTQIVAEIPSIIQSLTTSSPSTQRTALESYFVPNARFDHPICRIDPFTYPLLSRSFILAIYRWYKLLSPIIELEVESVAFDEPHRRLYVSVRQLFTFWFFPFLRVPATLVVVLDLQKHRRTPGGEESPSEASYDGLEDDEKYRWYIESQMDLYQFEQWVGFFPVVGLLGRMFVLLCKRITGWCCLVFSTVVLWLGMVVDWEGRAQGLAAAERCDSALEFVARIEKRIMGKIREKRE
ncbi:hypothetical protein K440DRAFT_637826 [Wilcoxina mikolae CBS 423.85]|nr:hypothetical protein K440DRAFT_637826 [Wilcoxina mikolae CBS 423.85]